MSGFAFFRCKDTTARRVHEETESARDLDLVMLRALIDSKQLDAIEVRRFADMLSQLLDEEREPRLFTLTAKQRAWVKGRCEALELAPHAENKADDDPYAAKFSAFARAVPERGVQGAWALVYSDQAPKPEGEA